MQQQRGLRAFSRATGEAGVATPCAVVSANRLRTAHRFRVSSGASSLALIAFLALPLMAAMAWLVGL